MKLFGYELRFMFAHWDLVKLWNWELSFHRISVVTTMKNKIKLKKPYVSGRGRALQVLFLIFSFTKPGRWPTKRVVTYQ